jgi:hypothetical protein
MDRRGFIRTSGLGALVLAASPATSKADEPRRFASTQDFTGKWVGSYDGRNARLTITVKPHDGDADAFDVTIVFEEVDRDSRYDNDAKDRLHTEKPGATPHILHEIELQPAAGDEKVLLKRLYLHTWNVDYLSGVSEWNGTEYGFSFKRDA